VNVTVVPWQIAPGGLEIIPILTGRIGSIVMLMELEVAGFPVAHVTFDVRTEVITSPFNGR
jgi:hypothetical protein